MRAWNALVIAGMVLCLAACGTETRSPITPIAPTPDAVVTPVVPVETAAPTRIVLPPAMTPEATRPITLTLWVPEEFAPGAERGGDILETRANEFEQTHPGIKIDYVLKAPYGKGGITDWILQLHELMPERLPDAAIVDSRDVATLQQLGLAQPLQRALPSGAYWDLFPPAQRMARQGGAWNNQPLVLETEHLVYDTRRVATPPLTWQDILTTTTAFAFAADSTDTFLLHYMHDGGVIARGKNSATDAGVMQNVLDFFQRARANGNLSQTVAAMQSAREIMPLFASSQVPMAQVRARDFLNERARLPNAAAAPVPSRDGSTAALASGWTYVILTRDSQRERAAQEYLQWIDEPAFLGEWAQAARLIPASSSAFAQAFASDAYADTLRAILNAAQVSPGFDAQQPYATAWHAAVQAVLNGQLSPEDAAFRALQTISP